MQPVEVDTTQAGKNADTTSSFVAIYVLFFLMYMVIMLYGMNVARSIIEEKTSRVFEVLLATIRPEEMMAGKMIGVGSVGLTQVVIWLATAVLLTSTSLVSSVAGGNVHVSLTAMQIIFFVVYFRSRLHALLQHRRRARRDDQLRAGTPAAQHVPRHAARWLHVLLSLLVITNPSGTLRPHLLAHPLLHAV